MRLTGLLFLLVLRLSSLAAQAPSYLHYSVRDGLPGNLVYCGLQDRRGLLWFGTDKGLACFDGIRFRTYGVADGLPDPEVLNMQEDSHDRLWLSCFRKKPCYMLNGKIITEKQDSLLARLEFRTGTYKMSEDQRGGTWLTELTNRTYYAGPDTFFRADMPLYVSDFHYFGNTLLALGLNGVMRVDFGRGVETIQMVKPGVRFHSVAVSGNHILYAYATKLVLLEWTGTHLIEIGSSPKPTGPVFTDRSGRFWVCSASEGAVLFDNDRRDLSNPVTYLPGKKVTSVFEDRQGTLWFGTINEGIFALQPNAPVTYGHEAGFMSVNIRSLAYNGIGKILAGDDAGSIHILDGARVSYTASTGTLDGYNLVRQIIPDGNDAFFAGSDEKLTYHYGNFRKTFLHSDKNTVKAILLLRDRIWIAAATQMGWFQRWDKKGYVAFSNRSTAIDADAEDYVWCGGMDGLFSNADNFHTNWGDSFPILKRRIMTIRKGGPGYLWVVTPGEGLLKVYVKAGKVTGVELMNNFLKKPILNIQSVFVEPEGRVWLATNRGVFGLEADGQVLRFDAHDGLADDDVNAVLVYRDTLWAGTVSGLTRVVLRQPNDKGDFQTFITGLRYQSNDRSVYLHLLDSMATRREIMLPSDASALEMDLAGLDYLSRGNMRFKVVQSNLLLPVYWWTFDNLIGWLDTRIRPSSDTTWVENGTFNFGLHLPAGRYKIRVTAAKSTGLKSILPDEWVVTKPPKWYESLWFYLGIWGLLAYGIWRLYRAQVAYREIHAAASVLQLQALQAQMNPHFIGNAVNAIQQFMHPPNPEKTSEYIALFMRLLRRTMTFSDKPFITLEEELSYDQEYLKLVHLRFENRFQYSITGAAEIPPETPFPSMLLQPILENATLHGISPTEISILRLDFAMSGRVLRCTLSDNGIGLLETQRQKARAGIERESRGLRMLQQKINTLNRLYDLDLELQARDLSELNASEHGTRVVLSFSPDKIWKILEKQTGTTPATLSSMP